ncbi:Crp/Fnr family transcriptional regulator [Fulvivirgaceae bacterium BMA10]|uniref:Crp/Fnr family transcriptional regulator n=1 Tax=Splendidivirga corallicola TaxID=3051826 RepID=A0ABT8KQI6_9BACT|nr:Crp/Fnr family transcriptional regulator [Fulvivirgaceae bacterium BMA10]
MEEEDFELLRKYFKPKQYFKGDFLVKGDETCDEVLFIAEGYFQVFVLNDIEENTIHIAGNGDFITALSSFISRAPSDEYVQSITDSNGLAINYQDLQTLYDHSKSWERLGRFVMENLFVRKQKRVISFIKDSAELRYEHLLLNTPELLQHIPLRILASYIGVKPETLSRIRAKIS